MVDDFSDLEAELKRLRPRAVSATVQTAVERGLAASPAESPAAWPPARPRRYTTATLWTSWKWANWSAAATLALLVGGYEVLRPYAALAMGRGEGWSSASDPIFRPVTAQKVVVSASEEGFVTLADGSTGQAVRELAYNTITWRNPATRASLTWTVPSEEVRVVPVRYQ